MALSMFKTSLLNQNVLFTSIKERQEEKAWDRKIGPLYEIAGIAHWLDLKVEEIEKLRIDGYLVSVYDEHGDSFLFPAWQFGISGKLLPHLKEVVDMLKVKLVRSPDEVALWLATKRKSFGGTTAYHCLRNGQIDRVLIEVENLA
jgi:hypothetical protein